MGIKLEGKPVVKVLRDDLSQRVVRLAQRGVCPSILIIRVGEREDDISYEKGILKSCEILGIKGSVLPLQTDVTMSELTKVIEESNQNKDIHGIMLFRPLPAHIDTDILSRLINPDKDIDCMSPVNLEGVFEGRVRCFTPCTPKAVIEMLKYYRIPLQGANVVVAGRSLVVGKPLSMLLLDENATVTICHSRTENLPLIASKADIVIASIGKAKFMDDRYFSPESIVLDVGINNTADGKICGDVDFEAVFDKVKAISPAIGGIGSITSTILLSHVVKACETLTGGYVC